MPGTTRRYLAREVLETERLRLRRFRAEDFEAYAAICADDRVMRWLGGTKDRLEAYRHMAMMVGQWELRGYGVYALLERGSGRLLGRAGFNHYEGWPDFEVAWTLAHDAWGHGFATEAARAARDHAFEDLGREYVVSFIHPANRASIAVAERIGGRFERDIELVGTRVGVYVTRRPAA